MPPLFRYLAIVSACLIAAASLPERGLAQTTDTKVSVAAKKKQKPRVRAAPVRQPQSQAYRGWRPADPSFDRYGRPYQPPPGLDCPVDLGYGRWGSCNFDY